MATNESLKKRPVRIVKDEDMNVHNIERINQHFDDRIKELDQRRIVQQAKISDPLTATAEDIATLLNTLIDALNGSNLTEN